MGLQSSKNNKNSDLSKYGEIYLQTDKSSYFGGDTVTGRVFLNMTSAFPGTLLFLRLKGKEAVHIVKQESRGKSNENIMYSDKKGIINQHILLHQWEEPYRGQLIIPFSFMLPNCLPPSFYQQGHRYLAFVQYSIETYIQPLDKTAELFKYKQDLVLRESIKDKIQDFPAQMTTILKTCGCQSQGSNLLKANFEKNFYSSGDIANVSVELDNSQSQLRNKKIVFSLKQNLKLKAKNCPLSKTLTIVKQEGPGIPKEALNNGGFLAIPLPPPFELTEKDQKMKKNPSMHFLLKLKDNAEVLTSTTKSSLITSEYFLEVSCPMSGLCAPTPSTSCPIGIYFPEFEPPTIVEPEDWNPQSVESKNLAFNSLVEKEEVKSGKVGSMMDNMMKFQSFEVESIPTNTSFNY